LETPNSSHKARGLHLKTLEALTSPRARSPRPGVKIFYEIYEIHIDMEKIGDKEMIPKDLGGSGIFGS